MPEVTAARNAVALTFALNGFCFATLVSRIPDLREGLGLDNGSLGLLLLAIAAGSVIALPSAGRLIQGLGAASVVRLAGLLTVLGLVAAGVGVAALGSVAGTAAGLFVYGLGTGVWDVAMNVEGAEVERSLGRTVMPRLHAAWSLGSIAGAGLGIAAVARGVPVAAHLAVGGAVGWLLVTAAAGRFLPGATTEACEAPARPLPARSSWLEPRTLAIGLMVLTFAAAEGAANDWLSLAVIDGYGTRHWVGVLGFGTFVAAMTTGRLLGPVALDRWGRAPVLWVTCLAAAIGVLLVVVGDHVALVGLGIVVWGLGASLGFPVGMSAAADDPSRAAARVSVVSTVGYAAFLLGPPLLGQLGDRVGTLDSLLAVAGLMLPAAWAVTAVRRTPVS